MKRGYEVTLYSDRAADAIQHHTHPTGLAYMFADGIACEGANGCDTFADVAAKTDSVHMFFQPKAGVELIQMWGPLDEHAGYAVDVRLKSARRMAQLEQGGARLEIQAVTPDALDEIARQNDLTLVATGKGGLAGLFQRDHERSVYDRPQRQVATLLVRGLPMGGSPFPHRVPDRVPVCFNFFGDLGECFWVPFYHKNEVRCWGLLIEAREGRGLDAFRSVRSADELLAVFRRLIQTYMPWDWPSVKDMELVPDDPYCWVSGAIVPTVRKPLGQTSSGRPIMALGDTAYAFDPVGGQGANCAAHQAAFYAAAIAERGDQPFDADWITATGEAFHQKHAGPAYRFNNVLLEPLDAVGKMIMISAFAHPKLAAQFFQRFNRPSTYFPWLTDGDAARKFIAETTGMPWPKALGRGLLKVARGQLQQRLRGRHFVYAPDTAAGAPA